MIDTKYNSFILKSFHECFTFHKSDNNIIYNSNEIYDIINQNNFSVHPNILENELYQYTASWDCDMKSFYYNKVDLNLNLKLEYNESLILHNSCGGGNCGIKILELLKLNSWLADEINNRYNRIEKPYTSIHIRNTDYKTNYIEFFKQHYDQIRHDNIFLATDSKEVLIYFTNMKKDNKLFTFIECVNDSNNKPIHCKWTNNDKNQVLLDTICDLILLSSSTTILYPKPIHGYTSLAISLFENKHIIDSLLGRTK